MTTPQFSPPPKPALQLSNNSRAAGPGLQLVPCDPNDPDLVVEVQDPATVAREQAQSAFDAISRPASAYLRMPWEPVDRIVGGVPPGDVWYVGGFSGDGKTLFLTSLTLAGLALGWRVYYLGLESKSNVIRTHFACKELGLDAGDLLSGKYLEWSNAAEIRESVRVELARQSRDVAATNLRISQAPNLTASVVQSEYLSAAAYGATVVIVDHVDHLADSQNAKTASDAVQSMILEMTQELGVVTLAASQLNLDTIRGNKALRHMPPAENCWKYGNKKREVASGMLAIYRPLRLSGVDKNDMARFRDGDLLPRDVCEPDTMAVSCTKHRLYGAHENHRALLGVRQGRVTDRLPGLPASLR